MTLAEDYGRTQKNIARLMVRRYLRSWLNAQEDEDLLIQLFVISMKTGPDLPMKEHAALVDGTLRAMRQTLTMRGASIQDGEGVGGLRASFNTYIQQEAEHRVIDAVRELP